MMVYRSKVDRWIFMSIAIVMIIAVVGVVVVTFKDGKIVGGFLSLLAMLVPTIFLIDLYRNTYYTIDDADRTLLVKGGILIKNKYDIDAITLVKKTNTKLNYPALSMDRIEIRFGKFSRVVVSPNDKEAFINHLKRLNSNFEINM